MLAPDHWDPGSDRVVSALQTWVVRSAGRTVLVDTGVGNGRERPGFPHFHRRQGDLPAHFAGSGVVEVRRSGTGGFAVGRWG
ncbi:hypothetical protein [Streptomyces sp. NY05-11A]|uniref:hypothetical protein n=1 Tax=Streptomyces soliscabiei TaxID=588897 RepID=UPI0039F6F7D8